SGHKKPGLWPGSHSAKRLFLVSVYCLYNFRTGFVSVAPAVDLDPFARFQILVVLEEVLDLLDEQVGQVGVFLHVLVQNAQLVMGYGHQLGIAAAIVGHVQYANRTATDDRARGNRMRGDYQYVQRVAIIGQGVRNEAVVGRVEHRGSHEAIDEQSAGVLVDLVLDRRMVGRDFDGDVDVVGNVLACGNLVVAHGLPDAGQCESVGTCLRSARKNMGREYNSTNAPWRELLAPSREGRAPARPRGGRRCPALPGARSEERRVGKECGPRWCAARKK